MPTGHHCHGCDHEQCAGRVPIFSALSQEELRQIVALIQRRQYTKGEHLLSQGDINRHLMIISAGKVKVYGNTPDGKEHIMYVHTDGDFFGTRDLLQEVTSEVSVQAMEDTRVCRIARQDFQRLLVQFPSISFKIMEVLCGRLEKMEALVRKISPRDVDSRIQTLLLELAHKYGRPHQHGTLIELPMNREEMANYIGVARETVSRKLALLRDGGIIQLIDNKHILIRDEEALAVSQ